MSDHLQHNENEKPRPSFYAIIPAFIRYDKDIEPNSKLFYGELTALCEKEGYCWASNRYFQDLYGVDDRTIRYWLESLKEKGYIKVDIEKIGMKTKRKIWICHSFQNISPTGKKDPGRPEKKIPLERKKTSGVLLHRSSSTKEQQQEPIGSVDVFYELMKKTGITEKDKKSIVSYAKKQKISSEDFANAINFVTRPEFEVYTTLTQAIMWALQIKPELPEEVDEEKNKEYARSAESFLESKSYNLEALSKKAVINSKSPTHRYDIELLYSENDFKNKFEKLLKEHRFTKRVK